MTTEHMWFSRDSKIYLRLVSSGIAKIYSVHVGICSLYEFQECPSVQSFFQDSIQCLNFELLLKKKKKEN